FGLEEQQLGDDQVREIVIDAAAEDDDPVSEETRIDVVRALTTARLLDDDGNQVGVHTRCFLLGLVRDSTGITQHGQHLWAWVVRSLWPPPAPGTTSDLVRGDCEARAAPPAGRRMPGFARVPAVGASPVCQFRHPMRCRRS